MGHKEFQRRHLDDIKKYVPEFIPEFVPELGLNTDFYCGTNSGMNSGTNFFMSSKLRLCNILPKWFKSCLEYLKRASQAQKS